MCSREVMGVVFVGNGLDDGVEVSSLNSSALIVFSHTAKLTLLDILSLATRDARSVLSVPTPSDLFSPSPALLDLPSPRTSVVLSLFPFRTDDA